MSVRDATTIFKQVTSDLRDIVIHPANYPVLTEFFTADDRAKLFAAVGVLHKAQALRAQGGYNPLSTDLAFDERQAERMAVDAAEAKPEDGYLVTTGFAIDAESPEQAVRIVADHLTTHAHIEGYRVEQYNAEGEVAGSVFIDAETLEAE